MKQQDVSEAEIEEFFLLTFALLKEQGESVLSALEESLRSTKLVVKPGIKIKILWAWYDLWIGAYWDSKKRVLYICPLPTIVISIGRWI